MTLALPWKPSRLSRLEKAGKSRIERLLLGEPKEFRFLVRRLESCLLESYPTNLQLADFSFFRQRCFLDLHPEEMSFLHSFVIMRIPSLNKLSWRACQQLT